MARDPERIRHLRAVASLDRTCVVDGHALRPGSLVRDGDGSVFAWCETCGRPVDCILSAGAWRCGEGLRVYAQKRSDAGTSYRTHRKAACEHCGWGPPDVDGRKLMALLAVHHKDCREDKANKNDDPSNLITLCPACHAKWHAQVDLGVAICRLMDAEARWLDLTGKTRETA